MQLEVRNKHICTTNPHYVSRSSNTSDCRDAVICFLERLAENTADRMPDSNEQHLPHFKKMKVYSEFVSEYLLLNPQKAVPSNSYFNQTWRKHCFIIKVRKIRRFSKCTVCEELRAALREASSKIHSTTELKRQKREHLEMLSRERREYRKKKEQTLLEPRKYLSLIIDGADQSAFGLPHFVIKTKAQAGEALKVRLIGTIVHGSPHRLILFTMTEEYETGANHIIETLYRTINGYGGELPSRLFIQFDNCVRENKNRYVFSYLEFLVATKNFKFVEVGFLPVGHTHEDIDQTFSRTSCRLRSNNAITLKDLQKELSKVYNEHTIVKHMDSIANWSALCDQEGCLTNVTGFTHYRYFKFSNSLCDVKVNCDEEWRPLVIGEETKSFIKFPPDVYLTPKTVTKELENRREVMKRIRSDESRINSAEKTDFLYKLLDKVYKVREEEVQCDFDSCLETNPQNARSDFDSEDDHEEQSTTSGENLHDYRYELNSFVIVRPPNTDRSTGDWGNIGDHFWVAKINGFIKNNENRVSHIEVHWYIKATAGGALFGKYKPSFIPAKTKTRQAPWKDKILSESVMMNLASLTGTHQIPANVRKYLLQPGHTS